MDGLALIYNNEFIVTVFFESNRFIDIQAIVKNKTIHLTFVYGDPVPKNRDHIWERLTRIGLTCTTPWFFYWGFY